jgi:hypothetical protein
VVEQWNIELQMYFKCEVQYTYICIAVQIQGYIARLFSIDKVYVIQMMSFFYKENWFMVKYVNDIR